MAVKCGVSIRPAALPIQSWGLGQERTPVVGPALAWSRVGGGGGASRSTTERSKHARPGMHMQHCPAVQT